jgi:hypothetical protein
VLSKNRLRKKILLSLTATQALLLARTGSVERYNDPSVSTNYWQFPQKQSNWPSLQNGTDAKN